MTASPRHNVQMSEIQKLEFVVKVQQEIINAQRIVLRKQNRTLPTDDYTRLQDFITEALKRLDEIHTRNYFGESA